MSENGHDLARAALIEGLRKAKEERRKVESSSSLEKPPTIPCTDLPQTKPGDPLFLEWNNYRQEVERLLSDGHEGQYVLIKGEKIIGIWPTREGAKALALKEFLMQPVFIHQIQTREPILRGPQPMLHSLSARRSWPTVFFGVLSEPSIFAC